MLVNAVFYVMLACTLTFAVLSAAFCGARIALEARARTYLSAGLDRARSSLIRTIAAQVESGASAYPLPALTPLPQACANESCSFTTAAVITLQTAAPSVAPSCAPAQTNCAQNVQVNPYVAEDRIGARITVSVFAGGTALLVRSSDVVLRTTQTPPYAAVSGSRDGSFDGSARTTAAGDDGGTLPATPNPCATVAAGIGTDTAVRVQYRNAASAACSDGAQWSDASYSMQPGTSSGWTP
ncbi:MAG: hypothetical protein ABR508_07165 [Candidatus Baltobacteraceae bacterium]